jgi:sugar lactone lactonase YvrE
MSRTLETVLTGLAFGEGPRWRDGRLWFSDMHAHEVIAMTPDGVRETVYAAAGPVSGLGWLPDGRLLVVSMEDHRLLRIEPDGRAVTHGDLSAIATGHCNDMVVDAAGRAYVGNFGFPYPGGEQKPARLARVDPDGTVAEAADGLMFPNGAVITPDGRTLIVGETFACRMTAFDIAADGALSNRRLWAALGPQEYPDGCCLDAEGAIWVASPFTGECLRVREGGEVAERIKASQGVFACMLGGADRRSLYVLTAGTADPASNPAVTRTGRIEVARVDAPGAGLP